MAFLDQEFNVDSLPVGNGNFDPLPEGWYTSTISFAELKKTKAGYGEYIAVKYTITGPTHQGRVVFGNLNIKSLSTKAEEIGRQQLREVMLAIGLPKVRDTDQLIGGQLSIKLSVKTGEYAGNEVKGYKAISASGGMATQSIMQSGSSPMSAPSKSAPPWIKK